jgi:hypothetical protein
MSLAAVACGSGSDDVVSSKPGSGGSTGGSAGAGASGTITLAGTGGSAGAAGDMGVGGAGGAASTGTVLFKFDTDIEKFTYNTFGTGDAGTAMAADGGAAAVLSDKAKISWDGTDGSPDKGSMKLEIPFSAYDQQADFLVTFDDANLKDFSKDVLYLQAKLDSGFSPDVSAPGGLVFYVQTTTGFAYGQSPWRNVTGVGTWSEYTFDLSLAMQTKPGWDPTKVKAIGIRLDTGSGVGAVMPPTAAVFHIDTIGHRPRPAM